MDRQKVLKAKQLAQEFISAANGLIKESEESIPDWAKQRPLRGRDYVHDGVKSGLVRHWSIVLTRALADMRNR